jgi:hypothetical protein
MFSTLLQSKTSGKERLTGRCASSLQVKQNVEPHLHAMSIACCPTSVLHCTANPQPGAGHHAIRLPCKGATSQTSGVSAYSHE